MEQEYVPEEAEPEDLPARPYLMFLGLEWFHKAESYADASQVILELTRAAMEANPAAALNIGPGVASTMLQLAGFRMEMLDTAMRFLNFCEESYDWERAGHVPGDMPTEPLRIAMGLPEDTDPVEVLRVFAAKYQKYLGGSLDDNDEPEDETEHVKGTTIRVSNGPVAMMALPKEERRH